jgi:outer membrane receptor protein involved in Fe transport
VEAEAALRPLPALALTAGWTFVDARVDSAPGRPELVGKAVPHDPAHRVAARVSYDRRRVLSAAAEVRWLSHAYEDDLNTLQLPAFAVVDLSLARELGRGVEVFLAVENLLDREYLVGRAGVDTVGAPRLVRGGLRLRAGSAGL